MAITSVYGGCVLTSPDSCVMFTAAHKEKRPEDHSERFDAASETALTAVISILGTGKAPGNKGQADLQPLSASGHDKYSQTPPALRGAQARPATWEPEADDPANELPIEANGHAANQLSLLAGGETASLSLGASARAVVQ